MKIQILTALLLLAGFCFGQYGTTRVSKRVTTTVWANLPNPPPKFIRDTIIIHDTIYISQPAPTAGIRATVTPFTVYLQWDSTSAKEYSVYKDGQLQTIINGLDTWVLQEPNSTSTYAVNDYLITVKTPPAITTKGRMIGDRKPLQNVTVSNGVISGVTFTTADIGKQISIEGARSAKWYRDAPLWGHGTITGINTVSVLDNVINSKGYYGTNNYSAWLAELADSTARLIKLSGAYIINPPANVDRSWGPPLQNKALSISGGTLHFGEEDAIGTELNHPPPPYYFSPMPLVGIQHIGGVLVINSTILGLSTRQLNNREQYPTSIFYRAEANSNPKQVFISGVFGDTANYLNGFFQGFRMNGQPVVGGKSVLAFINCQVANQELAGIAVTGVNPEMGIYDKSYRFIVRNSTINGTGRNTASLPIAGALMPYSATHAILRIDSIAYPNFTFYNLAYWEENPSTRNLLMKLPNADAGCCNQFTNIVWRPDIVPVSPYTALVPVEPTAQTNEHLRQSPLQYGQLLINTATQMQPSIGIEGHILYQNCIEIEGYNSTVSNYNAAFIRQNGVDNLKGNYKQWSLVGMTYTPPPVVSSWFEPMRAMGYYLQYSTSQSMPLIQFQGMGFVGQRLVR